ncbi:8-amino-7-oxononanoate synthase [Aliirhizobium smilacinae]|uniref:8-amino-7-oxononanoate synthase n=1 Tax=Aliirhizobium smilacinae TaxID=1395944 RepID=A0A5C4XDM4_9HYPH|nr:8-amino-7-oxononanoate synthase [Rhizobium smilacinae]TNM61585.1 8-amino-7-oxononanoate synthase [Rhizobium smilacinae]
MSAPLFGRYEATLDGLGRNSRLRELSGHQGIDFTSNDYLGLSRSPRLAAAISAAIEHGIPAGSGGSRLLHGNHWVHQLLEAEAAAFFGSERALYFGSGFSANVALFSCLPRRGDLIVYDELIHASVHDGISAGKADAVAARHNDVEAFDGAIRDWRRAGGKGRPWVAVESLYSMDGDRAPLVELLKIAERHGGFLVVDEAHATGVFGPGGRGLSSGLTRSDSLITLHTCGKALGVSGALVGLPAVLADYMVNRARNFIYSTAPSPLVAAGVREALRIVADEPERRQRLDTLRDFTAELLGSKLEISPSGSQIQPVMIGDNARALRVAARLQDEGFDIRAIRPPTVPDRTARLRLSITLNVDEGQIAAMIERLGAAIEEDRS